MQQNEWIGLVFLQCLLSSTETFRGFRFHMLLKTWLLCSLTGKQRRREMRDCMDNKKNKQKHLTEAVTWRIMPYRIEMNKYWINSLFSYAKQNMLQMYFKKESYKFLLVVNKQNVSVLPFQSLFRWTPHNRTVCFRVFYDVTPPCLKSLHTWTLHHDKTHWRFDSPLPFLNDLNPG